MHENKILTTEKTTENTFGQEVRSGFGSLKGNSINNQISDILSNISSSKKNNAVEEEEYDLTESDFSLSKKEKTSALDNDPDETISYTFNKKIDKIEILDILGKVVAQSDASSKKVTIPLDSNLPDGIYFISFEFADKDKKAYKIIRKNQKPNLVIVTHNPDVIEEEEDKSTTVEEPNETISYTFNQKIDKIEILDILGKVVAQSDASSKKVTIPLDSNLPDGIYFISFEFADKNKKAYKIIRKNQKPNLVIVTHNPDAIEEEEDKSTTVEEPNETISYTFNQKIDKIEILDILGKVVAQSDAPSKKVTIPLDSNLPDGIYFISFEFADKNKKAYKIIRKNQKPNLVIVTHNPDVIEEEDKSTTVEESDIDKVIRYSFEDSVKSVEVYDLTGKTVAREIATGNLIRVKLNSLPDGIYFVNVQFHDESIKFTKKIYRKDGLPKRIVVLNKFNPPEEPFEFKGTPELVETSFYIPGDRMLSSDWKCDISTTENTRITISITESQLSITIDPPFHLDVIWPAYNLLWHGLTYSFTTGDITGINLEVASFWDYLLESPIFGPIGYDKAKETIRDLFYKLLEGTDVRNAKKGTAYSPFKDEKVMDTIMKISDNFLNEFSGEEEEETENGVGTKDINSISLASVFSFPEGQEMMTSSGGITIEKGQKIRADIYFSGNLENALEDEKRKIDHIEVSGDIILKTADETKQVKLQKIRIDYGGQVTVLKHEMLNETAKTLETIESTIRLLDLLFKVNGSGDKGRVILNNTSSETIEPKIMNAIELSILEETLTNALISGIQTLGSDTEGLNIPKMMGITGQ